ncbi:zinc finger protein 493-like [Anoplophora glabripennis]|uniref:zinc finger protein 493-like n=1 Tax=Anoplophora glabripennis TaxID=217634 RepID=UPI000873B77A|nr:zinc finger protein 493-like [Anoplophora glabripennis]
MSTGEKAHHRCVQCNRLYKHKASLYKHVKFECGKNPLFACDYPGCAFTCKLKGNLTKHTKRHKNSLQSDEHRYQCDPLLSVTRIESEAGATICTYPVISSIDSLAAEEEKSGNTVPERPRRTKRKPMTKTFHRELVTKLRHKYVRQKHQNILICEKKGKLIATLRCVLCNLFVRKGEQFCYRCKEYLETGKKPPVQRKTKDQLDQVPVKNKCRICSVFIRNIRGLCYKCENVQKKIKKEANLSSKGKSLSSKGTSKTKPVDKKPPTLSIMKKSRIIKKKVVKKRKKNFRCESCNSFFVHNKGDLCQKCKKRFGSENTLEKINVDSLFDIKKTEDATTEENDMMKTVQSLNSIENVEIVEEDGEGAAGGSTVFSIPLVNVNDDNIDADKSDYYVSIDDINDMLEEDS